MSDDVTPLTQEVRFATTMTGGVSLAIWMGGVTRELNLLMQASRWRRSGQVAERGMLTASAFAELQLYRKLLGLLDVVADVDILSGTSAGGVNAVLLAFARERNRDLGCLRELWLDLGAMNDLLREPTDAEVPSLMYGDKRMFADLAERIPLLTKLTNLPDETAGVDVGPPTALFVTTTLLSGEASRFTDAMGTLVQDVDRRGVFTFTAADLKDPATVPALALAGRSTASFPGAFEPSFLPFTEPTPAGGGVGERPAMCRYLDTTRSHWAADGGLLDNQPLDLILQRIFDLKARRQVRRVLLYVVPSTGPAPDVVAAPPAEDVGHPPGLVGGLLKDLSAVTGQSIAADLRAIRIHNDRVQARSAAQLQLVGLAIRLRHQRLLTTGVLTTYCSREAESTARRLVQSLLKTVGTWPPAAPGPTSGGDTVPTAWQTDLHTPGVELRCREAAASALTAAWSPDDALPTDVGGFARYGFAAFNGARATALAIIRLAYTATSDAHHRQALTSVIEAIHDATRPPPLSVEVENQPPSSAATSSPVEPARSPLAGATNPRPAGEATTSRLDLLTVTATVCRDPGLRARPITSAATALANEVTGNSRAAGQCWTALVAALDDAEPVLTAIVRDAARPGDAAQAGEAAAAIEAYCGYLYSTADGTDVATQLFDLVVTERAMLPVELDPPQPVELVQLSADTTSLLAPGRCTAQDKLTGMQLHHFGAFYKRSWRANDWMWGRVDGVGWLVHVLLDPRRIKTITELATTTSIGSKAAWFLTQLEELGTPLPPPGPPGLVTADNIRAELAYLDDPSSPVPPGVPMTAQWVAQAWQALVATEELPQIARAIGVGGATAGAGVFPDLVQATEDLAATMRGVQGVPDAVTAAGDSLIRLARQTGPVGPPEPAEWSPPTSQAWAREVFSVGADLPALLASNPVPGETFGTDRSSPLMARTLTKALATGTAAVAAVGQPPLMLRSVISTARTITLGSYRVVSGLRGHARLVILVGLILLALGVAAAAQSTAVLGIGGLILAVLGGYLVVIATWQVSSRLLGALIGFTVTAAIGSLAVTPVRHGIFGTSPDHSGWLGQHLYWLGAAWWHPLTVIAVLIVLVSLDALTITAWGRRLGSTMTGKRTQ